MKQNQWWLVVEVTHALHKFSIFPSSNDLLELQIVLNSVGAREIQTEMYFHMFFFWPGTVYTGEIFLLVMLRGFL